MSIEAMKMALEAMEAAIKSGDWKVDGACDPDMALVALRQAIEQAEQKIAASPNVGKGFIDGVWHCQCGKAYEVTCISSKPKGKSWKSWEP